MRKLLVMVAGSVLLASYIATNIMARPGREYESGHINFIHWGGAKLAARVVNGAFLIARNGDWAHAESSPIIRYVHSTGDHWTAKLTPTGFELAPNDDWGRVERKDYIDYITWDGTRWRAKLLPNGNFLLSEFKR
jgi:hypothetical protein